MHSLGLINDAELKQAMQDVTRARDDLAQHHTFHEFVGDGVRDALGGIGEPSQKPKMPERKKPPKRKLRRKEDKDRDR